MAARSLNRPRGCSTICLPISPDLYQQVIDSPQRFRHTLDQCYRDSPELFPKAFAQGYTLKDDRVSAKLGLRLRRIECKATGEAFSVRPAFALPYLTGWTGDVADPLFLRRFGVPFWALARVFGRDPMYWYRLEVGLGRNSIVAVQRYAWVVSGRPSRRIGGAQPGGQSHDRGATRRLGTRLG